MSLDAPDAINVPDAIKKEADRCTHNLECLSTGSCADPANCKVSGSLGKNVLLLDSSERFPCPYHLPFGNRYICTCPVHYYLHSNGHPLK